MKIIKLIQAICIFLFVFSFTNDIYASANVVRVAFLPEMYGFYEIKENGDFSGYNYEYLMNVSQYTGWDYEFVIIEEGSVSASLAKAEEMLLDGELDLVGPYSITSASFEKFEIGEKNYGVYRYNFYSAIHNYAMTENNYFLKDKISVALVEYYTDLNDQFFHLINSRGYELEVTYVKSHAETIDLLLNEKVDTIINLDMSSHSRYLDYLTTVDRIPFYFASTKGNTKIISQLDDAITKIEIAEPDIHQRLLETYFGVSYDGEFLYTEQEELMLSKLDSFKVGFLKNIPPYQYFDENGENTGISIELLEKFEEIIGIPFEVYWFDTLEQLSYAIESAEIDMIGTLSNNYNLAHSLGVTLTKPYTSAGVYQIRSINQAQDVKPMYHYVSDNIPFYSKDELTMVWDIKSALDEMEKNGDVSIICDPYITDYYLSRYQYNNIEVKAVSNVLNELTFGVGKHIDENLIGMMNRAMSYLNTFEVDEIIFKHTSVKTEYTVKDFIANNIIEINIICLLIFIIIIVILLKTSRKFRDLSQQDSLTKLKNAGYFHTYSTEKTLKMNKGCLILIDIDYFKQVNDTYGHHKGDKVIILVGEMLKKVSNEGDVVARLGGDEFVILVENDVQKEEFEEKSQFILNELAKNYLDIPISLSIGGYIFNEPTPYDDLYRLADKVLYKVKENGRNGFMFEDKV